MQIIAGDRKIKDLTPKTTNIGNRLVKNMRICGSGIYTYDISEAHLLNLTPIPEKFKGLQYINVFRPPEVLDKNKDLFARVPIITGHHVRVDRENAKSLVVGMVGDSVETEVDEKDGETYLYTTGTIVAGDGVDAYEKYGQLSVGYDPEIVWEEGVHKDVPYQAVLKGFKDINHLLICKVARGGPQCMVMDSLDNFSPLERFINKHNNLGGQEMAIFKKIFGSKQTPLAGDSAVVSTLLQSIAVGADPKVQIPKIKEMVGDSDKEFTGFLNELECAGDEKPEVISKAVEIVDEYYKKNLAGDASEKKGEEVKIEKKDDDGESVTKKEFKKGEKEVKVEETEPEKGTAGDSIDYDLLATKLAEKMKPAQKKEEPKVEENTTPMGGDSSDNAHDSSFFMKEIWG